MIRLVAVAIVLAVATSAQAMSPAPLHQPGGMTTTASPPTPTVRLERPRSETNMGLSTMRGKRHLHVGGTSADPPPGQPQVLP